MPAPVRLQTQRQEDINERETKALKEYKAEFKEKVKSLIVITKDIEKEEEGIKFIPLWKWLLIP